MISIISTVAYLLALGLLAKRVMSTGNTLPRALPLAAASLGFLAHITLLYGELITDAGLNFSFFTVGSMIAATIVLILLLSSISKPVENLGLVLFPMAAVTVLLDQLIPATHLLPGNMDIGIQAHILFSILAYGLLTMATVQGVLLAIQNRQLHNHNPGLLIRTLPPLQTMEKLLFEMITSGFFLLSLSLITGLLFIDDLFAQHLIHKTTLSIVAWLVFGTLLLGRLKYGWRGQTAINWTLSGFGLLMLAYFGSKLVLELILGRV